MFRRLVCSDRSGIEGFNSRGTPIRPKHPGFADLPCVVSLLVFYRLCRRHEFHPKTVRLQSFKREMTTRHNSISARAGIFQLVKRAGIPLLERERVGRDHQQIGHIGMLCHVCRGTHAITGSILSQTMYFRISLIKPRELDGQMRLKKK